MWTTIIQIVLLSIFIFLPAVEIPAGDEGFGGKMAFLRSGEIWLANQDGGNVRRITDTSGKVEDFLFSPSLHYLPWSTLPLQS